MTSEQFESQNMEKSAFDRLLEEKQSEGLHYVGIEQLFIDRLKTETGKFAPTPYQTEEDIVKKYKEKFEKQLHGERIGEKLKLHSFLYRLKRLKALRFLTTISVFTFLRG